MAIMENTKEAFSGESTANRKYLAFSKTMNQRSRFRTDIPAPGITILDIHNLM
jgi:hypothetical protein